MKQIFHTVKFPEYSNTQDSIILDTKSTDDGWVIEIRLPKDAPDSDRIRVVDYLHEYTNFVRSKHPMWSMNIVIDGDINRLFIKQAKNLGELFDNTQKKVGEFWENNFAYD